MRWEAVGEDVTYQLQQASERDFADAQVRYAGPDLGSFISGLTDGETYFRVRAVDPVSGPGPWSGVLVVEVRYPSFGLVIPLMAGGCLMLAILVFTLITGSRKASGKEAADG